MAHPQSEDGVYYVNVYTSRSEKIANTMRTKCSAYGRGGCGSG